MILLLDRSGWCGFPTEEDLAFLYVRFIPSTFSLSCIAELGADGARAEAFDPLIADEKRRV